MTPATQILDGFQLDNILWGVLYAFNFYFIGNLMMKIWHHCAFLEGIFYENINIGQISIEQ